MATSSQKFIARNRAPRVQIEYDVELYGAEKKVRLPFVMGVLSDLWGKPGEALPPVADRKFLEFDVDNFDSRMKSMKPRVAFQVPNTLTGEGNLSVDILSGELRVRWRPPSCPGRGIRCPSWNGWLAVMRDAASLVALRDQFEQHAGSGLVFSDVRDVVKNEQVVAVEPGQCLRQLKALARGLQAAASARRCAHVELKSTRWPASISAWPMRQPTSARTESPAPIESVASSAARGPREPGAGIPRPYRSQSG